MSEKPIYVTRPHLPPLSEFIPYLESIWESGTLTNGGPMHHRLEQALGDYLGVEHVSLVANGTIGLITALQALQIAGEVITTPYSFVATAHALLWNCIRPVFSDIAPGSFNLDPARIEAAITPATTAIMPVHCYGAPCDVEAIQRIADRHGLKVIYDAAHAFGVRHRGHSILGHGDLSVLSFHATKAFHTFEGGAIVCPDAATKEGIDRLKNFGIVDETTVAAPGINGKMSEINAAFGLLGLKHIDGVLARRRAIDRLYRQRLAGVPGIVCPEAAPDSAGNCSYFPILVDEQRPVDRDALYHRLREHQIYARRYFYPLISDFPMYRDLPSASPERLPEAGRMARMVLCLPIYPALTDAEVTRIAGLVADCR
jgi:dTDP-4-amino-4,6-dideoxygalactose transaminase